MAYSLLLLLHFALPLRILQRGDHYKWAMRAFAKRVIVRTNNFYLASYEYLGLVAFEPDIVPHPFATNADVIDRATQ